MSVTVVRYNQNIDNLAVDPRYVRAPKLCDVLLGVSSAPWTLESFQQYLSANHCSENLDFIREVYHYQREYQSKILDVSPERAEANTAEVAEFWQRLVETFIAANSPREINIHGALRDHIIGAAQYQTPPSPDLLQPAQTLILELMNGIYVQWAASVHPQITVMPAMLESKAYCSPTTTSEINPESIEAGLGFYKRAHNFWGSGRVHRKIRQSSSERGSKSPTPEEHHEKEGQFLSMIRHRWSHP